MYTDLMVVISIQSNVTMRIDHGAATRQVPGKSKIIYLRDITQPRRICKNSVMNVRRSLNWNKNVTVPALGSATGKERYVVAI
jgi:hypothetical protein